MTHQFFGQFIILRLQTRHTLFVLLTTGPLIAGVGLIGSRRNISTTRPRIFLPFWLLLCSFTGFAPSGTRLAAADFTYHRSRSVVRATFAGPLSADFVCWLLNFIVRSLILKLMLTVSAHQNVLPVSAILNTHTVQKEQCRQVLESRPLRIKFRRRFKPRG